MYSSRILVVGVSLTVVILFSIADASACRCKETSLDMAYKQADAIVHCEIVKIVRAAEGSGSTATLKVLKAWKADVPEEITVTTATSCAYVWNEGEEHLIFLVCDSAGVYSTGRCLGNQRIADGGKLLPWLDEKSERSIRGDVTSDIEAG